MNTNWAKILLFSLLSFALGIVLCCLVCHRCHGGGCGDEGSCRRSGSGMHEGSCMHGEMGHGGKGACCKGMTEKEEKGACCKGMGHGSANADAVIEKIKASDFQGDTTVTIEGGTVKIHKDGDQLKVEVEMKDSAHHGMEEKTVEVTTH